MKNYINKIFRISNFKEFETLALEAFWLQIENNAVYNAFCKNLNIDFNKINNIYQIPFLPVEFFKNNNVVSIGEPYDQIFTSSGTTGMITSRHLVKDASLYEKSFHLSFEKFYGNISDYCILALLPSYLEREGSSLVYMASELIKKSGHKNSGFFLYDHHKLYEIITEQMNKNEKTLLLGVTFALLDFAEKYPVKLSNMIIMETGGMKGQRKEITRKELHDTLCKSFGINEIHGEYGMTELLSQAYAKSSGIYNSPPWMKIMIRDQYDPFSYIENGKTGGINIIDLANIYSCPFIETKDLGRLNNDDSFEVLGRFDNSDTRGCNLMVE